MYSKFGNVPTNVNGHTFHSKKEARRYMDLLALQMAGLIRDLETQPRFRLEVGGVHVCDYIADFRFFDIPRGEVVVEDTKGWRTDVYRLKKRLMLGVHGIEVEDS
ncbi:MAG: DUF1064 domain-containing protein [Dehalococcoidia bacterium]|nr:DUF1064 domain-containing protein [Dehalococcoidia bacterium]